MGQLMLYVLFSVSILSSSASEVTDGNKLLQEPAEEKLDGRKYKTEDGDAMTCRTQGCEETAEIRPEPPAINNRPIIGVLAQTVFDENELHYGDTYMMASYVSFLEMAGARVVPIRYEVLCHTYGCLYRAKMMNVTIILPCRVGENEDYYTSLFNNINGVLLPGGDDLIIGSNYAKAGRLLFDLAKKANDAGDYFPIFGICLGFELYSPLLTGKDWLTFCDAVDFSLPLSLSPDARNSRLLRGAPKNVLDILTNYNVKVHMHYMCFTPENFTKSGLDKFFRVISAEKDRKGMTFISTVEAKEYPFYGTQWHPEKNMFMWDVNTAINHTQGAVRATQYFANFFVDEARRSLHHFPDLQTEGAALIQNYRPVYLGPPTFDLNYYFNLTKTSER